MISWDDLLDDFEDLVEQIHHTIDLDEWGLRELPEMELVEPVGEPSADQARRLRELLDEAAALDAQVRAAQRAVRAELDQGRRAAQASRTYLGSNA